VRVIHRLEELNDIIGAKCVLASLSSLDCGYSFKLFRDWAEDSKNTIILPDKGPEGSLTRKLFEEWKSKTDDGSDDEKIRSPISLELPLSLIVKERVPLEGEELQAFLAQEEEKKLILEQEAMKRAMADQEDEDELSEMDQEESGATRLPEGLLDRLGQLHQYDIYVKDMPRTGGFFKHAQTFKMFPIHEPRIRVDEYGETIDPLLYMKDEDATVAVPIPNSLEGYPKVLTFTMNLQ
jgi:cleavage and polyadenylation specificity factor subunit 2